MKNVIYIDHFQEIGGVESVIYEISKKYKDKDITILYSSGNLEQVKRIRKYCRVKKWDKKEIIKCDLLIVNYAIDILDYAEAKKIIQLEHAMYITNKIKPHVDPRINEYYAVSNIVAKEFEELTGIKCKIARNPIEIIEEEKKKVLWLISATRLSWEKGKENMEKLGNRFNRLGIPFIWLVYTNDRNAIDNPNIIYRKPTLDIRPIIHSFKGKGYGVQLSKCEGDCIFTKECRALGVPVLVTPVEAFKEQGIEDGVNGYILPFNIDDLSDEKLIEIYENIPEIEYDKFNDIYEEILIDSKSTYEEEKNMKVKIRCTSNFYDVEAKLQRVVGQWQDLSKNRGDCEWIVNKERADYLIEERKLCELIEEIKEEKKEISKDITKKENLEEKPKKKTTNKTSK